MSAARTVNPIFNHASAAAPAAAPVAAAAAAPASAAVSRSDDHVHDLTGENIFCVRVHASYNVRVCIEVTDCEIVSSVFLLCQYDRI